MFNCYKLDIIMHVKNKFLTQCNSALYYLIVACFPKILKLSFESMLCMWGA